MQTVVETPIFIRRAEKLLTEDEHFDLLSYLATHPEAGNEIVGTSGVRKMRFAAMGKGKSGGVRVIYYFYDRDMPIYALLIYGKNERANLTPEQRKTVKAFATMLRASGPVYARTRCPSVPARFRTPASSWVSHRTNLPTRLA